METDNQLYSIAGLLCSYTKSTTGFDFIRCAFLLGFLSVGSMFIILGLTVEHQTVGEVFFFPLCNFFFLPLNFGGERVIILYKFWCKVNSILHWKGWGVSE